MITKYHFNLLILYGVSVLMSGFALRGVCERFCPLKAADGVGRVRSKAVSEYLGGWSYYLPD